jgi:hypothetical protein
MTENCCENFFTAKNNECEACMRRIIADEIKNSPDALLYDMDKSFYFLQKFSDICKKSFDGSGEGCKKFIELYNELTSNEMSEEDKEKIQEKFNKTAELINSLKQTANAFMSLFSQPETQCQE